jgi:copper chaperone CopZ
MKKIFKIKGMHCESCAKLIEMELKDKVKNISVNYETGKAIIEFDNNKISENEIKNIITKAGYKTI